MARNVMLIQKDYVVRVHGVPSHVWSAEFFVDFANRLGIYVCIDKNTVAGSCMDIARLMIRVHFYFKSKEYMKVAIDGVLFNLVFVKTLPVQLD